MQSIGGLQNIISPSPDPQGNKGIILRIRHTSQTHNEQSTPMWSKDRSCCKREDWELDLLRQGNSILVKESYVERRPSGPGQGWRVSVQNRRLNQVAEESNRTSAQKSRPK